MSAYPAQKLANRAPALFFLKKIKFQRLLLVLYKKIIFNFFKNSHFTKKNTSQFTPHSYQNPIKERIIVLPLARQVLGAINFDRQVKALGRG